MLHKEEKDIEKRKQRFTKFGILNKVLISDLADKNTD
jgi:hypothetical protein